MSISVLLVDDSEIMRKTITNFLKRDPEIDVVAEASSFGQAILLANTLRPQVIVLDIYMDNGTGVTSEIRSSLTESKVLAISFYNDNETAIIADSYGAVELLDKAKLAQELIPAIKRCIREN